MEHSYGVSGWAGTGDGRRLHYMAGGDGETTVVFVSGMGLSRSVWGLVQPLVAERTRAVVYDRAGTGRSDDDPEPRCLGRMASDLDALLRDLGDGPYVLVGHSWGAPLARAAAAAEPGRIKGLVLVDPTDEQCELYFAKSARRRFAWTKRLVPAMARAGLYRLGCRPGMVQPPDVAAEHRAEDFTVRAARTMAAELECFLDDLPTLRDEPPHLGDLPVTVISGTAPAKYDRAVRAAVTDAHRRAADALPNGRLVQARSSGHLVMFTEPELVAAEVITAAER
ncbi:alpha/beta hydrolase [Dactylosporangium vinaceum]|uniref:Alpha/beta fold hydrolase n=1 Tax=Dactylosporangium vinaceum TaxID=53362 RepID=A0ABV5M5R9_9ACTN|nr:alpha/beta hydrolase [Dactylosporangium vinaceum]